MAFVMSLAFATEHDKEAFVEKTLPKVRGHQVDAPSEGTEEDGLYRVGVAVTSQSAARDLCHQLVAFLAHSKTGRVDVSWKGADGQIQVGEVHAGNSRDAELLAVRVGSAAKAAIDAEKAAAESSKE